MKEIVLPESGSTNIGGLNQMQIEPDPEDIIMYPETVLFLLGGQWPRGDEYWWGGFCFDCVDHWKFTDYGTLTPIDGGLECPGPDLEFVPKDGEFVLDIAEYERREHWWSIFV